RLDGGGLGGGDMSRRASRDMKKHPADGARARTHTFEAERRVWQMLRSHELKGYEFRRQVPIGRYIADFVPRYPVDRGNRRRPAHSVVSPRSGVPATMGHRIL